MCDVCNNESGGTDVGVAAVPAAPVSVMWCDNCLKNNSVPRFVAEMWLFSEFYQHELEMPEQPLKLGIADWAANMTIWLDDKYISIRDAFPQLWKEAYEEILRKRSGT